MNGLVERLADTVAQAPAYQQLGLVLLGGLLTSANPCVLVAAPLVVGFTGGTKEGRHHPMVLSGVFVMGLAAAFTVLGLVAALTGTLLGDVGWVWKGALGLILLGIGFHLLGLFALPTPSHEHMRRFHGAGLLGAFALGGLTGTLSAPCATPALAAVLTLVALQKKVLWGGVLLFVYALGHGLLLFLAGASSGWASQYAQSRFSRAVGRWFPKAMGVLLLGCALWVLRLAWQARAGA
ncbi:cytochrome c biogenesis CcdA family protein [Mesoterricola silvestris]|uniref:Cytochrome C biogenesis protein CcdA n=1 Tax=Mesoterricola silvestris TaxID=2927979 RepID=A0AA48GNL0_9BACT|nr:cytochrome c biogenesis CcdA family protein [Mesoterricola silvestris]BDU73184.1 cytochrome C biogenesis protein CcdA [Mesoterricola silvestris]